VYLYSAIYTMLSLKVARSDVDHTVLPANYTMSAFDRMLPLLLLLSLLAASQQ